MSKLKPFSQFRELEGRGLIQSKEISSGVNGCFCKLLDEILDSRSQSERRQIVKTTMLSDAIPLGPESIECQRLPSATLLSALYSTHQNLEHQSSGMRALLALLPSLIRFLFRNNGMSN
jgi:hypothetical protein